MKNSLLLVLAIALAASFTQCKKKDTAPTAPASTLTISGASTQTFVVSSGTVTDSGQTAYEIAGVDVSGTYQYIWVFMASKPTSGSTIIVPSSSIDISFADINGNDYDITSGEVKVTIVGSFVVVSFTNAVFTLEGGTNSILASGSVTGS